MSYPNYVDFRDRNSAFADLMACHLNAANLSIQARENFRIWGYEVSGNYFEGLGIKPALGRLFGPSEDTKPGANPVIVLSYREWQTRFDVDPNVIGRPVKIDGYPFTVIGVAPPSFLGTELLIGADFWVPASMEAEIEQGYDWLHSRDNTNIVNEPVSTRFRKFSVRDVLVPGQIALSVMLVICSILVVRSLQRTLTMSLGFNPENAVSVSFDLRVKGYTKERIQNFHTALLAKLAAAPGIQSAGITNFLPLGPGGSPGAISRADRPVPKSPERQFAMIYDISPGYLRTAETRLLSGRDIDAHDRENSPPVAIVNEALAHVFFGSKNPLGQYVRLGTDPKEKGLKIIGVVETGKYISLNEDPRPAVFRPISQSGSAFTTVVARAHLPASKALAMLRKTILDLNPNLTLFDTGSLRDQLGFQFFPARGAAAVLGAFGVIAMVLAATACLL